MSWLAWTAEVLFTNLTQEQTLSQILYVPSHAIGVIVKYEIPIQKLDMKLFSTRKLW